jgi:hypothetical protein
MKLKVNVRNYATPKEELLAELMRVAKIYGKNTLSISEYQRYGRFCIETMYRRFGSWPKALKKAELKTDYERNIPIQKLFENLEEAWVKHGGQPTCDLMKKPLSKYHGDTYISRFGTWRNTLIAFEEHLNQTRCRKKGRRRKKLIEKLLAQQVHTPRHPSISLCFKVMKRDKFKCVLCGRSPATNPQVELEIDHIIPWSKGGETLPENLQTLCAECNNGKGNM